MFSVKITNFKLCKVKTTDVCIRARPDMLKKSLRVVSVEKLSFKQLANCYINFITNELNTVIELGRFFINSIKLIKTYYGYFVLFFKYIKVITT